MYFDNIYFAKADAPSAPTSAPTAPTAVAADVVSLYSEAYTTTSGFDLPKWANSQVLLSDTTIASNKVLKGDQFTFQGFQFDAVDATAKGLGKMHLDIWSKDTTPVKVYVISAGQDSEYVEVTPTAGAWKAVDIDLSAFTKIDKTKIIQVKMDTGIQPTTKTMYFDNIYFAKADAPSAPSTGPAAPTELSANVKSLFSDSYAPVDSAAWSTSWDRVNGPESVTLAGNNAVKKYTGVDVIGIEPATTLDIRTMDTFHIDVWRTDATADFKIKLVDFGSNGIWGTSAPDGDNVEHELIFNATNGNAVAANQWVSLDIPLSHFTGLTSKGHLAQLLLSSHKYDSSGAPIGSGESLWIDNVYFYNNVL